MVIHPTGDRHTFVIAPTRGTFERLLISYVGGPNAVAMTRRSEDKVTFALRGDENGHGKPRTFAELPGRCFIHTRPTDNVRELLAATLPCSETMSQDEEHAVEVEAGAASAGTVSGGVESHPLPLLIATSRIRLLGFLAFFGLVPKPGRIQVPVELEGERAARAHVRSLLPTESEGGAALTAVLTWRVFECACSRERALFILATLKGRYDNFYPACNHCDHDKHLESWMLRYLDSDSDIAPTLLDSLCGATLLPLRALAFQLIPDLSIGHAFFRREWHAAYDGGVAAARSYRGGVGGRPTAFVLQSGGCSERRLAMHLANAVL